MIVRILAGSMVALGLGLYVERAHADQTFLCEDGRMLQVRYQDLERLKRTEPCIAAHYGLKIESVPLPVKRPTNLTKREQPQKPVATRSLLKGPQTVEHTERGTGRMAQATVDYRNVRIINAQPGANAWYSHTR